MAWAVEVTDQFREWWDWDGRSLNASTPRATTT